MHRYQLKVQADPKSLRAPNRTMLAAFATLHNSQTSILKQTVIEPYGFLTIYY